MEKTYTSSEQKNPIVQKKSNGGTASKAINQSARQQIAQKRKRRRSLGRRDKIRFTMKNTFHGTVGMFDSYRDSTFYKASDSLVGKLSTFSNAISYKTIGRYILAHIKELHKDVILVPEHTYAYKVSVDVYPDSNTFEVTVKLKKEDKHKKAGLKAREKEKARKLEKETNLQEEAEKKAKSKLQEEERIEAEIQDMKMIILADGTSDLVIREVWEVKEKRLQKLILALPKDITNWKKQLDKSYNEAGIIARIGYAYSGHGVTYSKPDLWFYWNSAYEYQLKAFIKIMKQDLVGAEHEMSMAIWSAKEADKIWSNWLRDSARGAGTAVSVLTFAKYSGVVAATFLSGGAGALVEGPALTVLVSSSTAAGFGMAYETADQGGKILAGSQKEFDLWRIGKIGAANFFLNFVGGGVGAVITNAKWGAFLFPKLMKQMPLLAREIPEFYTEIIALMINNGLQELGTTILGEIDPATFKRPEDLAEKIVNNPSFLNQIMYFGEKFVNLKKK
jgi:hypothetical protein